MIRSRLPLAPALAAASLLAGLCSPAWSQAPGEGLSRIHVFDVWSSGDRLYLAETGGVRVLDVRDPLRPREVGKLRLPASVLALAPDGDRVGLCAGSWGLGMARIIEDPPGLAWLGRYDSPGSVLDAEVRGGVAYIADDQEGLAVVDVSDPARMRRLGRLPTRGPARALDLRRHEVALAAGAAGFGVVDVSRPDQPERLGWEATREPANDVRWVGDTLWVAMRREGVRGYRAGPHGRMEVVWHVRPGGRAVGLVPGAETVAVCLGDAGVAFLTPAEGNGAPQTVARLTLPGSLPVRRGRWAGGGRLFVALDRWGWGLVEAEDPSAPRVLVPRKRRLRILFPGHEDHSGEERGGDSGIR